MSAAQWYPGPWLGSSLLPSFATSWQRQLQIQVFTGLCSKQEGRAEVESFFLVKSSGILFFPRKNNFRKSPSWPLLLPHQPDMDHRPVPRPILIIGKGKWDKPSHSSFTCGLGRVLDFTGCLHIMPTSRGFVSQKKMCVDSSWAKCEQWLPCCWEKWSRFLVFFQFLPLYLTVRN